MLLRAQRKRLKGTETEWRTKQKALAVAQPESGQSSAAEERAVAEESHTSQSGERDDLLHTAHTADIRAHSRP